LIDLKRKKIVTQLNKNNEYKDQIEYKIMTRDTTLIHVTRLA